MRIRLRDAVLMGGALTLVGLGIGIGIPAAASGNGPQSASASGSFPHMDHVFVIMMENTTYTTILAPTNADTSYIRTLAGTYGLETQYYGVTHTSLPNYVAATSGSTWGSHSDDETQATQGKFAHLSLFDQFDQAGVSWKAYMQSMPSAGYTGNYGDCTSGPTCPGGSHGALYVRKHNPAMQYPDIFSTAHLAGNVVPLTQLTTDLRTGNVPQFSWISPNICDDMHGGAPSCPYATTTPPTTANQQRLYTDGDTFLRTWVNKIMSSKAWTGNSAIFVTWDEAGYENSTPYGPKTDPPRAAAVTWRQARSTAGATCP
jgi:phospholipase C